MSGQILDFKLIRFKESLDKFNKTNVIPDEYLTGILNIEDLKNLYYKELSEGYKKIFANLQRKLTSNLRKTEHNLQETFSEEYNNFLNNMRTKKDVFVFPSIMQKYRKDINPARALYFEITNLMLRFNSVDENHIWLLGLFRENTWRKELIHSCLVDIQKIDDYISKYFHHMKKQGNVSLEMMHIIEIRKDLRKYVKAFEEFANFTYDD